VFNKKKDNSRILVISDYHAPYQHKDALAFLKAVKKKFNPTRVISVGDEIDFHSQSIRHPHDPNLHGPQEELEAAIVALRELAEVFPDLDIMNSNHGDRLLIKCIFHGIPTSCLKDRNDILMVPKTWVWHEHLDLVLPGRGELCRFVHGEGAKADKRMHDEWKSIVQGHHHSLSYITTLGNSGHKAFAMQVGCLLDPNSEAYSYNKSDTKRPFLSCGLILDGEPVLISMDLNDQGFWSKKIPKF
jgi:hypothetical protein